MKRMILILLASASALLIPWAILHYREAATLRILFHGKPASNLRIDSLGQGAIGFTDANGEIRKAPNAESMIVGFNSPDGGFQTVSFPKTGHREYNFAGPHIFVRTTHYEWGVFPTTTTVTMTSLSDDEIQKLESGKMPIQHLP